MADPNGTKARSARRSPSTAIIRHTIPINGRPDGFRSLQKLVRRGQTLALEARTSHACRRWSGVIQGGIQSQAGDNGDGQGLANNQQLQSSIRTIRDNDHQGSRKTPSQLPNHLLSAVGQLLGLTSTFRMVTLRGSQYGHEWQRSHSFRPGKMCQQHQADSAQTTRFHKVVTP